MRDKALLRRPLDRAVDPAIEKRSTVWPVQYFRASVLAMGSIKTWIDWAVLALCMIAALGAVFFGINAVEATAWSKSAPSHAAVAVLGVIAALAVVNCGLLIGAAACKARRDLRLGRR